MKKQIMLGLIFCFGLLLVFHQNGISQTKTKDELKAEREVLKSEMKSKEAMDRDAKLEKLQEPAGSELQVVDNLASSSTTLLRSTKEINEILPEMYKRTIGETIEGVTDVTVKKPKLEELTGLAANLIQQGKAIADLSKTIPTASDEVKKAKPMQAVKATKSLNYSKDVIALLAPEIELNLKIVNHLIDTLKTANNM